MKSNKEKIKSIVIPILREHDVVRAAIFGSFARGEERSQSDIDLLVEFKPGKSLLDLAALKIELEEVLNRNVDVLTYKSIHRLLRDKILKEQEVLL